MSIVVDQRKQLHPLEDISSAVWRRIVTFEFLVRTIHNLHVSVHTCVCKIILIDSIYLSFCSQISNLHDVFSSNATLHLNIPEAQRESLSDRHDTEKHKADLDRDRNRDAVEP